MKPYVMKPVAEFSSLREMTEIAVSQAPDVIAYRYKSGSDIVDVTYSAFYDQTENLGAALCELGLGKAHFACIAENSYKWIVSMFTALRTAGVFIPIDKELPAADKINLLTDSDSDVLFYSAKYEDFVAENKDKLPNIKYFVAFDKDENDGNVLSMKKLISHGADLDRAEYDALLSDENEVKMIVYTSGTTGIAKGVMLTEHNLVSSIYYGLSCSQIYDTGLSVLPYNHVYESVCDILVTHHFHATLCINDSLKDVLKNLKLFKPSHIYLVPAFTDLFYTKIMQNIKKQGKEKKFNFALKLSRAALKVGIDLRPKLFKEIRETFGGRLRRIVCGGAPIRPEIGQFFGDIGIAMTGGYGITECSPLVCVNDPDSNDYHTAGHRLACIDWKIDEPNEDGIGEICIKGDIVMKGYYKQPEKTAEALKDGWFYTGDYGYITDDDQLVITGRKKNLIVLNNGKNIYPEEIEGRIGCIPYVTEVIVRGLKNELGDEYSLMAEVYMAEEQKEEAELLADIHKSLADLPAYKNVTKVVIRSEPFPKTTSNKIRRNA